MRTRSSAKSMQVQSQGVPQVHPSSDQGVPQHCLQLTYRSKSPGKISTPSGCRAYADQACDMITNIADNCFRPETTFLTTSKHTSSAASASDSRLSALSNTPHSKYQADQAGCARAQPYLHNSTLRQAPRPADVDPDQLDMVPTQQVAVASAIDNIDITTPEPDETTGMLYDGNDNTAASQTQTPSPSAMQYDANDNTTASQSQTASPTNEDALASDAQLQVQSPQHCTPVTAVTSRPMCHSSQV